MALSVGEALVRLLAGYGVETVFGIPGVHTLELYRGLGGQYGVRHVQARNELGAGFMADGYARATGHPGVIFTISGPGVTNAATALGQAHADSVPMLLISAEAHSRTLGKGTGVLHEVSDLNAVTRPLCAISKRARTPEDIPDFLARAFTLFASGRPRPCHLSIPLDVLGMEVSQDWQPIEPPQRPVAGTRVIDQASQIMLEAERPLILAGGGARGADVTGLAECLGAPVLTSNAGKGVVPESHPLSLGGGISRKAGQDMIASADVIIAIGTELSETDSWLDRLPINGRLVRIDIDPAKMSDAYRADAAVVGDAAAAVEALKGRLADHVPAKKYDGLDAVRAAMQDGFNESEQRHVKLLNLIRDVLPEKALVFGDACQLTYTSGTAFRVEGPGLWHYAAGYCALGFAFPMAVGAKIARPQAPVVAFAGDGGMQFTLQELVTAAQERVPVPVILWHNDGYKQIRDDMRGSNVPRIGVDGWAPDYPALAGAMHCLSSVPESQADFRNALEKALAADRPTLIVVREDSPWLA